MYTYDPQEEQDGAEHVGGYNAFNSVVDGSDEDGPISHQELKVQAKSHIESLLRNEITKKHKWGETTGKVVAEVHDEEEILKPTNMGVEGF